MPVEISADLRKDRYFELVQKFPLRPIRSDEELQEAIAVVDSLIGRGDLDAGEQDYLDVLSDIVEKFEADEQPMRKATDGEMLKLLIEDRGLNQKEVALATKIAVSTISEVLNGRRKLTRSQVASVAEYFGVAADLFGG